MSNRQSYHPSIRAVVQTSPSQTLFVKRGSEMHSSHDGYDDDDDDDGDGDGGRSPAMMEMMMMVMKRLI